MSAISSESRPITPEERVLKWLRILGLVAILAAPLLYCVGYLYNYFVLFRAEKQPIHFSHRVHAGPASDQIDCTYCHTGARTGEMAGVLAVEQCMTCHKVITEYKSGRVQAPAGVDYSVEIAKLHAFAQKKQAIEWDKVYDMPEHVKFSHQAHINAGKDCVDCHGKVEEMETVQLANVRVWNVPTMMGWCVQCHIENEVSINCALCHY